VVLFQDDHTPVGGIPIESSGLLEASWFGSFGVITVASSVPSIWISCVLSSIPIVSYLDPDEYEDHIVAVLEEVHQSIPRVFVSLVEMFNLSQVYDLSLKTKACVEIHRAFFVECDCIFKPDANATRQLVDDYVQAYNNRTRAVAKYYQALNDPSFTVVAQPFGRDTMIKDLPTDFLSTLDCFHPSLIAHQGMAIALWNNLLTPAAYKKTTMNITDTPLCPTPDTLLYTY